MRRSLGSASIPRIHRPPPPVGSRRRRASGECAASRSHPQAAYIHGMWYVVCGTGAVVGVFFLRRDSRRAHVTRRRSLHTHAAPPRFVCVLSNNNNNNTTPQRAPREDNAGGGGPRPIHCASRLSTGVLASSRLHLRSCRHPTSPPSPLLFRERVARCSVVAAGVVALCIYTYEIPEKPGSALHPRR